MLCEHAVCTRLPIKMVRWAFLQRLQPHVWKDLLGPCLSLIRLPYNWGRFPSMLATRRLWILPFAPKLQRQAYNALCAPFNVSQCMCNLWNALAYMLTRVGRSLPKCHLWSKCTSTRQISLIKKMKRHCLKDKRSRPVNTNESRAAINWFHQSLFLTLNGMTDMPDHDQCWSIFAHSATNKC